MQRGKLNRGEDSHHWQRELRGAVCADLTFICDIFLHSLRSLSCWYSLSTFLVYGTLCIRIGCLRGRTLGERFKEDSSGSIGIAMALGHKAMLPSLPLAKNLSQSSVLL